MVKYFCNLSENPFVFVVLKIHLANKNCVFEPLLYIILAVNQSRVFAVGKVQGAMGDLQLTKNKNNQALN